MPQKRKGPLKGNQRLSGSVKKLPSKSLQIDVKIERKDYYGIVERIKREFVNEKITPVPDYIDPMLAIDINEAFNDRDWLFEIDWNGCRTIACLNDGMINIFMSNDPDMSDQCSAIKQALQYWPVNAVVDGELVIPDEEIKTNQRDGLNRKPLHRGQLLYYVSDLLWLDGISLLDKPLAKRREVLKKILPDKGFIRYSDAIEECGIDLFHSAIANGFKGIVAKRKDSAYVPGKRMGCWLKVNVEEVGKSGRMGRVVDGEDGR